MAVRDFRPEGRLPRIGVVVLVTCLTAGVAHVQGEASAAGVSEPSLITRDAASITFPRNYWSPEYRATLVAIEFLKSDWEQRINLDQADRALADFEAPLKIQQNDARALYGRGAAKLKQGDEQGGNADIEAAKKIRPDIAELFGK